MFTSHFREKGTPPDRPDFNPHEYFKSEVGGRLLIDPGNLCKLLQRRGWRRHRGLYAREAGGTLIQGDRGEIIRDLAFMLRNQDELVYHKVMKQLQNLTTPTALELLPELQADILRDDRERIFLPFRNGILLITKEGLDLLPYNAVNSQVWAHKIIDRDFMQLAEEQLIDTPWLTFLKCTCTRPRRVSSDDGLESRTENFEAERFTALQATIGKMIHTYNNPSNPVAVIFTDETGWDDENSGGTGKSLIAEAIRHLRTGITIQCRDKKKNDAFFFDSVTGDIDVLILDDLDTSVMAFSQLYGYLTSGLEVNRKGEHHVKYPFEDNPRFVITTNQAIKGSDVSDVRRRWDMQLLPYFDLNFQPKQINHGNNFFEDWTPDDWLRFDNIMARCCVTYFQTNANNLGCPHFPSNTVERSIRQEIGNEIVDWMDCYLADKSEAGVYEATEPLATMRSNFNEETSSRIVRNFSRMLMKWASLRGVDISIIQERYSGKSQQVVRLKWQPF